ncbi:PIR Superfamily Protein [Plasmodium ovale wallikeri]|uniref:PIR Superfamily Protein n=1 Tax=Plasmodium ovale wallikeri TaxID=864142 RepID=A0A1A9ARF7_PLAOA|nr:PIR Superfamily Protein [Plasmodium ovale wallikeri]
MLPLGKQVTQTQSLIQNNKGCKDFNFIIDEINQKINSLFNDILDIYKWTQEIKNWRTNYFSSNTDLKCDENDKYIKPVLKDLYDFCEDKIFIEENLPDIEKSVKCQSIYADLSERKVHLINSQSIIERHIERKRIPDISCNTEILDSTFPSINCSVIYKSAPEGGAHISNANHNGREESKERLANQSMNTPRELSNREQGLFTVQGKNETNSDSPSNSIGLVSLPILGTLVLSYLLYRYTPLGHKLHAYFRNNEDVPVNQNYEETNKMLSNISNSNDIYSENMQYNISYQTL